MYICACWHTSTYVYLLLLYNINLAISYMKSFMVAKLPRFVKSRGPMKLLATFMWF